MTSKSGPGLADCAWIGQFERRDDDDFWFFVPTRRDLDRLGVGLFGVKEDNSEEPLCQSRVANASDIAASTDELCYNGSYDNLEPSGLGQDECAVGTGITGHDSHIAIMHPAASSEPPVVETLILKMGECHAAAITACVVSRSAPALCCTAG